MAMNRVQFQPGLSMADFMARYGSDDSCEAALIESRWFLAMQLLTQSKNNVAALELMRHADGHRGLRRTVALRGRRPSMSWSTCHDRRLAKPAIFKPIAELL